MRIKKEIDLILERINQDELLETLNVLKSCKICPRECGNNRFFSDSGYCKGSSAFSIASICKHHGEEPVISGSKGICNIFFSGCNIQCIYCQNYQISTNNKNRSHYDMDLRDILKSVVQLLDEGCHAVGFVSTSHYLPQMRVIIELLKMLEREIVFVMNTNAYDKIESISEMEDLVDIYLPDFKYMDDSLARKLSDSPDYSKFAGNAIKEMYRQKGSSLKINDKGEAESGLIIRHLVLPGYVENSIEVLRFIAQELSPEIHLSLMSQYHPTENVHSHPDLKRSLRSEEYEKVVDELHQLGFENGWVQSLDSSGNYNPNFYEDQPF